VPPRQQALGCVTFNSNVDKIPLLKSRLILICIQLSLLNFIYLFAYFYVLAVTYKQCHSISYKCIKSPYMHAFSSDGFTKQNLQLQVANGICEHQEVENIILLHYKKNVMNSMVKNSNYIQSLRSGSLFLFLYSCKILKCYFDWYQLSRITQHVEYIE
jgi:hypothetical protein